MAAAILLKRGINPRRKWEYERNDLFNKTVERFWAVCTIYLIVLTVAGILS